MVALNFTHDSARRSWVASANVPGCAFPIQNLPFGVFSDAAEGPRGGVAIGDRIVDLRRLIATGLLSGDARAAAEAACGEALNPLLALGNGAACALRHRLFALLAADTAEQPAMAAALLPMQAARMELPGRIGAFTDFFASIFHTERGGRVTRPDNPVPVCYRWLPIGYNSRASSVRLAEAGVTRPNTQWRRADGSVAFGPTESLDYELELGAFVGGGGNALGAPVSMAQAPDMLFGYCLLNDWSARDLQRWESTLGPFLSKAFATSISPWIVTAEALAPFAHPNRRPQGDPAPLPYLDSAADRDAGLLDIGLTVHLRSAAMRAAGLAPQRIAISNTRFLYWSFAQMAVHHASGGCNLQPGDLFGSGTISGPADENRACLSESTQRGADPLVLPTGERRAWLEDGDELIFGAVAEREGFAPIGFGTCAMLIRPAPAWTA
jgi:fumarylacetoacetase